MEENFNIDDSSRELPELHLKPTEFTKSFKSSSALKIDLFI